MYPDNEHPYFGIFVKNTENVLQDNGYKFTMKAVITEPNQKSIKKAKTYFNFYMNILKGIFNKDLFDLIYVHFISHSALPVIILKIITRKPLILNVHGSDVIIRGKIAKILSIFSYPLVRICDKIVVPSEYFKDVVKNKFKITDDKIVVYPSGGIDMTVFKPISTVNKKSKQENLVLGYVSRIEYGKGWDIFIKIIKELQQKHTDLFVKGIIIGEGKDKNKCIQMIKDYGLENNIEYLGGLSQKEISYYFNLFDIFVFPTRLEESLGLVGLEAMSCKTPVVGSKIGGIQTYIKNGINGYLANVDDVSNFVNIIENYINLSEEEKKRIIENAYKTAMEYDSNLVIKSFVNEIDKIAKE